MIHSDATRCMGFPEESPRRCHDAQPERSLSESDDGFKGRLSDSVRSGRGGNLRGKDFHLHVAQRCSINERIGPTDQLLVINKSIEPDLRRLHPAQKRVVIACRWLE